MRRLSYLVAAAMIAAVNAAGYIAYQRFAAAGSDHDVSPEVVKAAPVTPDPAFPSSRGTTPGDGEDDLHDSGSPALSAPAEVAAAERATPEPLPKPDARVDSHAQEDEQRSRPASQRDHHPQQARRRARDRRQITRPRPEQAVTKPSPPPAPRVEPAPKSTRDRLTEIEENPYKQHN